MNAINAHNPRKRIGGKPLFAASVEDEISLRYFDEDKSAATLANEFAIQSRTGRCSASAIRQIAERCYRRAKESQVNADKGGK